MMNEKMKWFERMICTVVVMLLWGMATPTAAQTSQFTRFYNVSLPYLANEVKQVWQDSQGMIWLITRQGVYSYDGYNTRKVLEGSYSAAVALNERILILGSDNGLRFLDIRTERLCTPLGQVPVMGDIRALALSQGMLYVGTKSNGLFSYDTRRRLWQRYMMTGSKADIVYAVCQVGNRVYIGHLKGLSVMDARGNVKPTGISDNVYSVDIDARRRCLWIGTEHSLLRRDIRTEQTTAALTASTYNHFLLLPNGNLLVSTEDGMLVYDPDKGTTQAITHDVSLPQYSLPSNRIHHFFLDRQNNIWIATDHGVAFARQTDPFEYRRLVDITQSHLGNTFTNVVVTANGEQWLGGENGVLHLTPKGYKWFRTGHGLRKNMIRHIYEDRDHDIWIASDASIARYDRKTDSFVYYTLIDRYGRNADWAYALYEDRQGRLWVATYMSGLFVVDKKSLPPGGGTYRLPKSLFSQHEDLVSTTYKLMSDGTGRLWANTSKGLVAIDTRSMEVTLKRRMFIDGMTVAAGSVWIDVQGHLYRYDTATDRYTDTGFDLEDGMIYAFVPERSRLWMSTSEGLFYLDLSDHSIHASGKPEYRFTTGVYVKHDNSIAWGGQDVVARQRSLDKKSDPATSVFVTGISVGSREDNDVVPRFASDIRLNGRKNVTLYLSTYDYGNRDAEVLWYKLGESAHWLSLPAGTNNISLPAISGGTYQLYLSANPHSGVVSSYTLRVPYPWYQRWWAWMFYVLCALSLGYAIITYFRRRAQQEYKERERENALALTEQKMDFFVQMSHEVKTPLSLIIAPLEKLLSETTNARLREKLKAIHGSAMRLSDIINRILDFKRMEAEGDDRILDSHVDLVALVREGVNEFALQAETRHIVLQFQSAVQSLWMDIDIVKIQSVVRNLLSNATKYVAEHTGRVVVSVDADHGCARVSVSDNGPGVPKGNLRKIFFKYYKGDNLHNGTGLGLAVARKYVELHGGNISAENTDGLTVTFTLPIVETAQDHATTLQSKQGAYNRPVVLIVDDNHDMVDFLRSALNDNYQAEVAFSGEEALERVSTSVPALIITDQMMPGMDGLELCKRLRRNYATASTPIIMLTAKDDQATELRSITYGADVFMPKPFNLQKLQLHIVQLLKKRQSIEKLAHVASIAEEEPQRVEKIDDDEKLMSAIMDAINANMSSEEFNVSQLCRLLSIDQKQLYRKMKALTGQTPVSFIREQKLKRAASLLRQGNLTVSEVMYQVGFSSMSYFNKCFTAMYHASPKDYKHEVTATDN